MQCPRVEREPAGGVGPDRQLLVAPGQVLLAVVGALGADHCVAECAVGTVGGDDDVVGDGVVSPRSVQCELAQVGDDPDRPLLEAEDHAGFLLCSIEQQGVEAMAGDRVDRLRAVGAVGLERQLAVAVVHHPPADRQPTREDVLGQADAFQRVDPPRRQREVDRTACRGRAARVAAPLVQRDVVTAAGQEDRKQ